MKTDSAAEIRAIFPNLRCMHATRRVNAFWYQYSNFLTLICFKCPFPTHVQVIYMCVDP